MCLGNSSLSASNVAGEKGEDSPEFKKSDAPREGLGIHLVVRKVKEGLWHGESYDWPYRSVTFVVARQRHWRNGETVRPVRRLLTHAGERFA